MVDYIFVIPIALSFFVTLFSIPFWIRKARENGLVGKDLQKTNAPLIPESGGINVVIGFTIGAFIFISLNTFVFNTSQNLPELLAMMSCILLIALVAFTDDVLGWKIGLRKRTRLILIVLASIPLVAINAGKSFVSIPFIGQLDLGLAYPLIIIPLGIVGATATFNFLAGFNGLEAGQGIILLSSLALVSYFTGSPWLTIISLIMVASLLAFMIYNFYPARVFPGDSLTYVVGGMIAIVSILGNFEKVAVFFFIPYILEFVLKSRGRLIKQSFGKPDKEGGLDLRYDRLYSLNHVSIYLMKKLGIKATEMKAVLSIWIFQLVVVIAGFVIFRGGIF